MPSQMECVERARMRLALINRWASIEFAPGASSRMEADGIAKEGNIFSFFLS